MQLQSMNMKTQENVEGKMDYHILRVSTGFNVGGNKR